MFGLSKLWTIVIGVAVLLGIVATHSALAVKKRHDAVTAGKQFTRDSIAQAAGALLPALHDTVRVFTARTDTVIRYVTAKAARVVEVGARVPDTVRLRFPVVDTLIVESRQLADSVKVLRADVLTERSARDSLRAGLSMLVVAARDSLHVELKRPKRTWRSNAALSVGGAVVGVVGTIVYNAARKP